MAGTAWPSCRQVGAHPPGRLLTRVATQPRSTRELAPVFLQYESRRVPPARLSMASGTDAHGMVHARARKVSQFRQLLLARQAQFKPRSFAMLARTDIARCL